MTCLLGIDTGGTYTDAVLVDEQGQILATAKSLTTRYDLTLGIGNVLGRLPVEGLRSVGLVCLSTTLTTNSVVEGTGAPVCALLMGYDHKQIEASGLLNLLGPDRVVGIPGAHDAVGMEVEALDEAAVLAAVEANRESVSAFAVSGMFSVRNPSHEIRARELVSQTCGKPVTCGHELASSLGAPRRAMTVALNAGMIPHINRLIDSVRQILLGLGIEAPLMMVKGDGSLINAATALRRPVGTVLSGPAASVIGACALSGHENAIVADMGGTTTDIAVVRKGRPELNEEGALIGDWRPMVEAVQVYSIGLGGDSEVRFSGGEGLKIGPRRVVPISLLVHQHPEVLPGLQRQAGDSPNARHNRFVLRLQQDEALLARLSEPEWQAWEMLAAGPIELDRIVEENRPLARALGRLERQGLAIYSGFTPSDVAHVLDLSDHWSRQGAELGASIWVRQMRRVYGLGNWANDDVHRACREVLDSVVQSICLKLVEAGLNAHGRLDSARAHKLAQLLTTMILDGARADHGAPVFDLAFAADSPLVAVGAPVGCYYPEVSRRLKLDLQMPQHGDVANAVGAVMGSVVQRAHITVTQPFRGTFRVFGKSGPKDFSDLSEAVSLAESLALAEAVALAREAGAEQVETHCSRADNSVDHDIDGALFFDARVTATASGRPRLRRQHSDACESEPPG